MFLIKPFHLFLLVWLPLALPAGNSPSDPTPFLTLVREHQPEAVIVINPEASQQVLNATHIFQQYIYQSTGALLPIQHKPGPRSIHIGDNRYLREQFQKPEDLDEDGFILHVLDSENLVIIGGSDWGTEFGVYDFLERYVGVRWLMPTDLWTEIPIQINLCIPLEQIREEPIFLSRRMSPIEIERTSPPRSYSPWRQYQFQDTWGRFNRTRYRLEYHHNLKNLFPPSKFAQTHPEFYPTIQGKRIIPANDNDFRWQPNFSASGIVEAAIEEINLYFQENPQAASYSLGVNDLRFYDDSPASKARRKGGNNFLGVEDVSDDYFLWANTVVAGVLEKHPGKQFGTLAYSSLIEPPSLTEVHPAIVPFLTFERMRWSDPQLKEQDQQLTLRWQEKVPSIGWYDYIYGRNYLVPRVWYSRLPEYLRWGANHNVHHYVSELYPNWGEGAKAWVHSKMLWNPFQDMDALLADWYQNAVGTQAAPLIRQYYELWDQFWTEEIFLHNWDELGPVPAWNRRSGQYLPFDIVTYLLSVPEKHLVHSRQLLDQAYQTAETDIHRKRIQKLREMWDIYESSILVYQTDNLWRTTHPQNVEQALQVLQQCEEAIILSQKRLKLLDSLRDDDLHGHAVYRIKRSQDSHGEEWGTTSLWVLLPWISKSSKIRTTIESLQRESDSEAIRTMAGNLLTAADQQFPQLLNNPEFNDGLTGWQSSLASHSKQYNTDSHNGLTFHGVNGTALNQSIPCQPGLYYLIVEASTDSEHEGTAILALATTDNTGRHRGRERPVVQIPLFPGQWNTLVIPFTLDSEVTRIQEAQLKLSLLLEDFESLDSISIRKIQCFRVDSSL